jgi:hypothetical protein
MSISGFQKIFLLSASFALLMLSPLVQAQNNIAIPRVAPGIVIDAKLDEPAWQHAKKVAVNNITHPQENMPSSIETTALLMEDGTTFYIAFIAKDPEPQKIRAFLRDRDKSWNDDQVGVKIDTYNDQRLAYQFFVNALGVQSDAIENEMTKQESSTWDGIWESYGRIVDDGYIVEIALPLRMFNFNENLAIQNWGIELVRFYPREERQRISNVKIDRNNNCWICQMATASGFKGAKQGDNLTLAPAFVWGYQQERDLDESRDWQSDNQIEPSLDLRWGINPDISLNATLNPDFSTVEADTAQLSINTTFALFFPEKRPFFLDNADYFATNFDLVYTRNINAPDYGGKLTGRYNEHTFAAFITNDENTNVIIGGNIGSSVADLDTDSHNGVLRYRYDINKDFSVGWIATHRTATDYSNTVNGIDARLRYSDSDLFKLQYLHSATEYPDDLYEDFCNGDDCSTPELATCTLSDCDYNESVLRTLKEDSFSDQALRFSYNHDSRDWGFRLFFEDIGKDFRADLGFMPRIDRNKLMIGGERKWYSENSWWNKARIYSDWDITHNDNGELIEKEFDLRFNVDALLQSHISLGYTQREHIGRRHDASTLAIDGNTDRFNLDIFHGYGEIKPVSGLTLATQFEFGDNIDFRNNRLGTLLQLRPEVNWNVNEHIELKLRHTLRHLDADSANVFIARLTDARLTYQFDVRSFLRLSVIYNNTSRNPDNYLYDEVDENSKDFATELLYAYKINPQTVFYLGYSDNSVTDEDFSSLEQDFRRVFTKVSYAWMK